MVRPPAFQLNYSYDNSELAPDEMSAAVALQLHGPEGWCAAGMDAYDQDDSETTT
jgi:hypothetical protein